MKYNQPPIPISNELKQVLQSSLGTTEAGLINVLSKYDDNYCWGTLNQEAKVFKLSGYSDIEQASADLIDRAGLHDLQQFINECKG